MSDFKDLQNKIAPKFIRGNIHLTDGQVSIDHPKALVSVSGVYGLRWPPFVPAKHYGKFLIVKANIPVENGGHFRFEAQATVMREFSLRSERMGLKFHFSQKQTTQELMTIIDKYGHVPTEYLRRYPRIPSQQFTKDFKIKVAALSLTTALNPDPSRLIYRVGNLSPDGMLLITDEEEARAIRPGDLMDIKIIVPKNFADLQEVHVRGKVFRALQEVPMGEKEDWHFGVKFSKFDQTNQARYFALLRAILNRIKDNPR